MQQIFVTVLTVMVLTGFIEPILAATYHVRPDGGSYGKGDGSDWNNALSGFSNIPWSKAGPGTTIYIAGGDYRQSLNIQASGNSSSYLRIRRATADDRGSSTGWQSSFDSQVRFLNGTQIRIASRSWVEVEGKTESGFYVLSVANVGPHFGYWLQGVKNVILSGFGATGQANGDDFRGVTVRDASNVTVRNGRIQHMPNDAVQLLGVYNSVFEHLSIGPRISSKTGKHADGFEVWETGNNVLRNSVFDWSGDMLIFGIMTSPSGRWDIYGNQFTGKSSAHHGTAYKTQSTDAPIGPLYFYNNSFYRIHLCFRGLSQTTLILRNNVFHDVSNLGFGSGNDQNYNFFSGVGPQVSGSNNVLNGGDPFRDAAKFDLNLKAVTTARDNGLNVGSAYRIDPNGNIRGANGKWDIGAFEWHDAQQADGGPQPPTGLHVVSQ
jgi:hypothetical protein